MKLVNTEVDIIVSKLKFYLALSMIIRFHSIIMLLFSISEIPIRKLKIYLKKYNSEEIENIVISKINK